MEGTALYCMLATWGEDVDLEEKKVRVVSFFNQMAEAHKRLRALRSQAWEDELTAYQKLWEEFPEVLRILNKPKDLIVNEFIQPVEENAEDIMDLLVRELQSPILANDFYLEVEEGQVIVISGSLWNLADWSHLAEALKKEFGAKYIVWSSSDYTDAFDVLRQRIPDRVVQLKSRFLLKTENFPKALAGFNEEFRRDIAEEALQGKDTLHVEGHSVDAILFRAFRDFQKDEYGNVTGLTLVKSHDLADQTTARVEKKMRVLRAFSAAIELGWFFDLYFSEEEHYERWFRMPRELGFRRSVQKDLKKY